MSMFAPLLEKLHRREDLSVDEAAGAMAEIMDGRAQPSNIAALLVALGMKGERPAEIVGLARVMRSRATALPFASGPPDVFDTCGTGGDGADTFNVSTAAALVVAACGVRVAKHGNRSVSSRCGSADVFESLGVKIDGSPAAAVRCLEQAGIAFLFAPTFHPSMRHAGPTRKELGIRTAFNLLGPLTNPAGAARQLVGVPRPELTELVARSLGMLGTARAWVVHGADGLDELSTTGYSKVSEYRDGAVNTFYVHPSEFGVPKAARADLKGGDAAHNAGIIRAILDGRRGAPRDIVVYNAGASLLIAGRAATLTEGAALAADAIDAGRARDALARLVAVSNEAAA